MISAAASIDDTHRGVDEHRDAEKKSDRREDRIISPLSALRFSEDIPNTQLHLFDHCGHAPHIEYAQEVANHLTFFLKQFTASN